MKSSQFPRGLPFKAPPLAAANEVSAPSADQAVLSAPSAPEPTDAFRAWAMRLAMVTVGAVAVIVLLGVLGIVWLMRPAAASLGNGRSSAYAEPVRVPGPTLAPSPRLLEPAEMKPGLTPDEPKPRRDDLAQSNRDPLLKSVGSLTAASLYQTYITLGLLADSSEKEVYSPAEARKLLTTLTALLDSLDTQLAAVAKSELDSEDAHRLQHARQLSATLRVQAKELRAYWDTPEEDVTAQEEHERQFHQARDQAWVSLKELLAVAE
jgi:hypothetical protein